MVYEKCITGTEEGKLLNKQIFEKKKNRAYAACLKNTVNFLVAWIH
jgi:hypothetical protein